MGDPVVYFEILGADSAVLRDFYSGLFGWAMTPAEEAGDAYQLVDTGAGRVTGGLGAFPGAPSHVTFYVAAEDRAAIQAKLELAASLGGRTIMAPRDVTAGITTALFADPEGHVVGLISGLPQGDSTDA
jgi:uncharacterized protein